MGVEEVNWSAFAAVVLGNVWTKSPLGLFRTEGGVVESLNPAALESLGGYAFCIEGQPLSALGIDALKEGWQALEHIPNHEAYTLGHGFWMLHATPVPQPFRPAFERLLDASPDPICIENFEGRIRWINRAFSDLWGIDQNRVQTEVFHMSDLLPNEISPLFSAVLQRVKAESRFQTVEYSLVRSEGLRDFEVRVVPSGDQEVICLIRDISERKRVDHVKSEFISIVSHELRTPLTAIRGALGLMAGGVMGELSNQAKSLIDIAYNNAERLANLVNAILDMERLESGQLTFEMKPLLLNEVLERVFRDQGARAQQSGLDLSLALPVEPFWVQGDFERLLQVMSHLISNAIKFSSPGQRIEIETKRVDSSVHVEVRDRGRGIAREFHERIFTRFSQADTTDVRTQGGAGLGLAISRAIVERHGGQIGFQARPNGGTVFYFQLPVLGRQNKAEG